MKIIFGDLLKLSESGLFDVIVHGANCFHTMGGGIAVQISKRWPEARNADLNTIYGDYSKLGTYSCAHVFVNANEISIVNAYTQFTFGYGKQVDYAAVSKVFGLIAKDFVGKRIGYPKIGAGLAGGDWSIISEIIDRQLEGQEHTLVEWNE